MSQLKYTHAVLAIMLWLFTSNAASSQEAPDLKGLPIPPDLKSHVQLSIDLGRELYWQDKASAIGTDALMEKLGTLEGKGLIVVLGKHCRVIVSEDGRQVQQVMPLSKTMLELKKDKNTVALFATHLVTDYPLETHVFASMLNNIDIYVGTQRGLWLVKKDAIALSSLDVPGKENK